MKRTVTVTFCGTLYDHCALHRLPTLTIGSDHCAKEPEAEALTVNGAVEFDCWRQILELRSWDYWRCSPHASCICSPLVAHAGFCLNRKLPQKVERLQVQFLVFEVPLYETKEFEWDSQGAWKKVLERAAASACDRNIRYEITSKDGRRSVAHRSCNLLHELGCLVCILPDHQC